MVLWICSFDLGDPCAVSSLPLGVSGGNQMILQGNLAIDSIYNLLITTKYDANSYPIKHKSLTLINYSLFKKIYKLLVFASKVPSRPDRPLPLLISNIATHIICALTHWESTLVISWWHWFPSWAIVLRLGLIRRRRLKRGGVGEPTLLVLLKTTITSQYTTRFLFNQNMEITCPLFNFFLNYSLISTQTSFTYEA